MDIRKNEVDQNQTLAQPQSRKGRKVKGVNGLIEGGTSFLWKPCGRGVELAERLASVLAAKSWR